MKIYHGTSFENACQILSKDLWVYPIDNYIKSSILVGNRIDIEYAKDKLLCGNHFTTSLSKAISYANETDKPVVLTLDYDTESCLDFTITHPIDTTLVSAVQSKRNNKYGYYGLCINNIYKKKYKNGNLCIVFGNINNIINFYKRD